MSFGMGWGEGFRSEGDEPCRRFRLCDPGTVSKPDRADDLALSDLVAGCKLRPHRNQHIRPHVSAIID